MIDGFTILDSGVEVKKLAEVRRSWTAGEGAGSETREWRRNF
jgi:hypothetical protein